MQGKQPSFSTIDDYIAQCPAQMQPDLQELRQTIRAAAPKAEERISYRMPSFYQNGTLVYFALMKNHIGFYPTGSGVAAFQKELKGYATSKGAVRFPIGKPLPLGLVTRIVKFKVAENSKKSKSTARKQK